MPEQPLRPGTLSIEGLADMTIASGSGTAQGRSTTWTRWYDVGPDLSDPGQRGADAGHRDRSRGGSATTVPWAGHGFVYVDERPYTLP